MIMKKRGDSVYFACKFCVADCAKLNKIKRHLETVHAECVGGTPKSVHRKRNEFSKQKRAFAKITTVILKQMLAPLKVANRTARCEIPHSIWESIVLPAPIVIVELLFD
jgi:hypothetical protein